MLANDEHDVCFLLQWRQAMAAVWSVKAQHWCEEAEELIQLAFSWPSLHRAQLAWRPNVFRISFANVRHACMISWCCNQLIFTLPKRCAVYIKNVFHQRKPQSVRTSTLCAFSHTGRHRRRPCLPCTRCRLLLLLPVGWFCEHPSLPRPRPPPAEGVGPGEEEVHEAVSKRHKGLVIHVSRSAEVRLRQQVCAHGQR